MPLTSNGPLRLELPSDKYLKGYFEAVKEDELHTPGVIRMFANYDSPLKKYQESRLGINLKPGYVPATTLWLVDDSDFYGEISIRHRLTESLLKHGGNIGYAIRYSKRGQGYGKLMLKLALEYAYQELGLRKVMLTCYEFNKVSEGVMLANGATLGEALPYKDEEYEGVVKKFWINITSKIIECDRFYLREYQESDYADLSQIYQDAKNMVYFGAPYDDKKMRCLIDWTMDNYKKYGFGFWAIIDKQSGEFIGDCGLSMQKIDGEWLPEIGYHIKMKYHNMGYASEAAKLVKEYVFKNYSFPALYGYTHKANVPSIKVMQHNGMSFVKEYREDGEIYVVYSVKR